MRDYAKIAEALRYCSTHICNTHCGYYEICHRERQDKYASNVNIGFDAADAIEELLAKVPHWISVEDELPEEVPVDDERWSISVRPSADVNIYLPSEGAIVTAFYSWADGTWTTVNEDRIYYASEVLFWSKLPAPQKEVD